MNTEITTTSTGYKLKIGTSDFSKLVTESDLFVDKTLLIHDIIDDANEVLLITRPRRWGKTLNMSMLEYFFSIATQSDGTIDEDVNSKKYDILSKMAIGNHTESMEQYCGKYPVIFVSFKDIKGSTYEAIEADVRNLIYKLYTSHEYLMLSPKLSESKKLLFKKFITEEFSLPQLKDSIAYLVEMLYSHFNKNVIVLIDEYDAPMNDWYSQKLASNAKIDSEHDERLQKIFALFRGIFSAALKDNKYLEKGVITGILRIAKASLFSGLNNFGEDSILDNKYSKYFGFTEEEVANLLHRSNLDRDPNTVKEMQSWYNGYNIGGITIYNPWSIMNWLSFHGQFKAYWVGTASTTLLEKALMLDTFQAEIQNLVDAGRVNMTANPQMVFSDITSSPNALYNLLLFSGYLTAHNVESNEDASYYCEARIPNREVRGIFTSSIQKWVSNKFGIEIDIYREFINNLLLGDVSGFITQLKDYLEFSASFYSTGPKNAEVFYNGLMLGLIASISNKYFVETEKESGEGRVDLMLVPKANTQHRNAIVIEFKSSRKEDDLQKAANGALEQIKNKNYISKIKSHDNIHRIISVGLAFCGKDVEVAFSELSLKS